MNIAIIPASSTSKRLPGKNILPVNGKPIIFYVIESAVKSGLFEQVIVSSKDEMRYPSLPRQFSRWYPMGKGSPFGDYYPHI